MYKSNQRQANSLKEKFKTSNYKKICEYLESNNINEKEELNNNIARKWQKLLMKSRTCSSDRIYTVFFF